MDFAFEPVPQRAPAFWGRWRGPLVAIPAMVGLVMAAAIGAGMLLAEPYEEPAAAQPTLVTCWDGSTKISSKCGLPQGVAGLRWVFPSFKPLSGRCERTRFRDRGVPRPLEFVCLERVSNVQVEVTYTHRTTVRRGLTYVASTYAGISPGRSDRGEVLTYRAPTPDGDFKLTRLFERYPYSVSVLAPSKKLREKALSQLVQTRPAAEISIQRPTQRA